LGLLSGRADGGEEAGHFGGEGLRLGGEVAGQRFDAAGGFADVLGGGSRVPMLVVTSAARPDAGVAACACWRHHDLERK